MNRDEKREQALWQAQKDADQFHTQLDSAAQQAQKLCEQIDQLNWKLDRAMAENERLRKCLAEVRRRVIVDYYTGTNPDSPHRQACRLCNWAWHYGESESHNEGCPMESKP